MKADSNALEALHELLAQTLSKAIKDGQTVVTKDGEAVRQDAPASLLSVARQFLKDNEITAGLGNKDVSELEKAIKDMNSLPLPGEVPKEYQQ